MNPGRFGRNEWEVPKMFARGFGAAPWVFTAIGSWACGHTEVPRAPVPSARSESARTPAFDDSACRDLEPLERALCRVKQAVTAAEAERDRVRAVCSEEVGQRIGDLAVQIDAVRVARLQAGDPAARANDDREAELIAAVEGLSLELDGCIGIGSERLVQR